MRKSYLIMFVIILIFSMPFTYGGCSGGGGGGSESAEVDAGVDVKLNVPYVPNYGNTCVTSSFTMVLKYYRTGAEFADVWNVVGYPADYDAFDYWIRNDYDLRLELLSNQIIDDIIHYIDEGFPVIAVQQHSNWQPIGHARVVIGYNLTRNQFIVHDPSNLGPNYRMSFDMFVELWENLTDHIEPWWEPTPAFLIIAIDDPIP
jgi:hypothetical protein